MDFSVGIYQPQNQRENGENKIISIESKIPPGAADGRNIPLKLAQLLNSESEDSESKATTRASSVGADVSSQPIEPRTTDSMSTVNTRSEKSIMKISHGNAFHDQHGLMTPESSENLSPSGSTANSEEMELKHCLELDARRSALHSKYLNHSWSDIERIASECSSAESFTKGETDLIVQEFFSPSPIDFKKLEEECFSRSNQAIQELVSNLSIYYSDMAEPNLSIISALETCLAREEYLRKDVLRYLPEESIPDLRTLLPRRSRMRPRWSSAEVEYISNCIINKVPEELMREELLFRTTYQVGLKVEALRKKLLKANPDLFEEEDSFEQENKDLIQNLLENDLTKSGIHSTGDEAFVERLVGCLKTAIEQRGGSRHVPYSKAEQEYLRGIVQTDYDMEEIQKVLIFRSRDEIQEKLDSLRFICVRQKKFANSNERLVYEAEWYSLFDNTTRGGRRRRARDDDESNPDSAPVAQRQKTKRHSTMDEETRRQIIEKAAIKRRETLRLKRETKEKRMEARQARVKATSASIKARRQLRGHERPKTPVDSLLADASWFQSITGDGNAVRDGQKRARKQAVHFVPEFETRQKMKLVKKKIEQKKIEKKRLLRKRKEEKRKRMKLRPGRRGPGRPKTEDYTDDSEASASSESESEQSEATSDIEDIDVSDKEEEDASPFDPINVLNDTLVPTKGRQCFNESISTLSTTPEPISFSPDVSMLDSESSIPFVDNSAIDVMVSHSRNYKAMPKSFPPFTIQKDGNTIINPRNIVRVRYLLYPEHSDAYILAQPKSNELNPINEIQKMMQIQSALYFAHSPELQEHIYEEYCQKLKSCAENDKFNQFMIIIDKWNLLMLELTPYLLKFDPNVDINREIRYYLPFNYRKNHSVVDLNLNKFFFDVVNNGNPKKFPGRKPAKMEAAAKHKTIQDPLLSEANNGPEGQSTSEHGSSTEDSGTNGFVSKYYNVRPAEYPESFLRILALQKQISRFAVHQILTTAYTRIVGPNSRKLRSYKAFTAEVYGELLPSFISEVLTKVGLEPKHSFYDLGSGVGNTTFQAALEFGVKESGGCEIMSHASSLTSLQKHFLQKKIQMLGLNTMNLTFALSQSFVNNEQVREKCLECNVLLVNNYLFEFPLNVEVGKLLYGLKPGSKIISLKNFIPPRYKAGPEKTVLDYLKVEKFEMSDFFSVSWTANKVPYYISTVMKEIRPDYL